MSEANKPAKASPRPPTIPLHVRIVDGVRWRLGGVGLHLNPYVCVQEGVEPVELPSLPEPLRAGWASVTDIDALTALWNGYHGTTRDRLEDRFRDGNRCFAVWDGKGIPAATWCDLDMVRHRPEQRPLAEHEVYLFDAYVSPAARGRNLAPIMRAACYEACRALGRTTMLSYTAYFNESSHRFKAKLGARKMVLRLELGLFGRWSKTFTLRRY